MPHYRDGSEAQVGDFVKGVDWEGKPIVGMVTSVVPGSTTCNMTVSYLAPSVVAVMGTFTIGEFDKIERPTKPEPPKV
jgi:hypothetical protein